MSIESERISPVILRTKKEAVPTTEVQIVNSPVDLNSLTEPAKKSVLRRQHRLPGMVPVAVVIRGGSYFPFSSGDNTRPWDAVGEFRFSLFLSKGQGKLAEHIIRYTLANDGRLTRLKPSEVGSDVDKNGNLVPIIDWWRDVVVRGVDAKISRYADPETGEDLAALSFIAVPETGQWLGSDSPRAFSNSSDNPTPFLKAPDVIF